MRSVSWKELLVLTPRGRAGHHVAMHAPPGKGRKTALRSEQAALPFAAGGPSPRLRAAHRHRLALLGGAGLGARAHVAVLEFDVEPDAGRDRGGGAQRLALRTTHQ